MRLCIPTLDERGRDGRLAQHFGRAPYFALVDSDSGDVRVLANLHGQHDSGNCRTADALLGFPVDVVVCRGLGRRAYGRLREMGIPVFVSEEEDVSAALEAFRRGQLRPLRSEAACHRGRHHHD